MVNRFEVRAQKNLSAQYLLQSLYLLTSLIYFPSLSTHPTEAQTLSLAKNKTLTASLGNYLLTHASLL